MRSTTILLSLGSLALAFALPSVAAAQDCKVDADCPRGFACELYDVTTPPSACTKDAPCPVDQAASTAPTVAGSCRPATCQTDTDCGTDMVCHSETYQECSGGSAGGCAPDTKCDPAPPIESVCTQKTVSTCAYRWQLPCSVDTDCGAGFTCLASVKTTCPTRSGGSSSGSGGGSGTTTSVTGGTGSTGTATGSSPTSGTATGTSGATETIPPDSVAECTTSTSFPGYCQPTAATCTTDTDCPAAWTCQSVPGANDVGGVTGSGSSSGGTATGGPATPADGSGNGTPSPATQPAATTDPKTVPPSPPTVLTNVCVSPFGDTAGRGGTLTGGSASDPASPPTGTKESVQDAHMAPASSGCSIGASAGGHATSWSVASLVLLALARAGRRRSRDRR